MPKRNHFLKTEAARFFLFAPLTMLLMGAGCATRDMSANPRDVTDYRVGSVYQLRKPVYILGGTGLVVVADRAREQAPAKVEAVLSPGTFLKVRQIVSDRNDPPRTEIYAEVINGPSTGRIVNLRTASLNDPVTGKVRWDADLFERLPFGN
jgi:hypothetical protein